MNEENHNGKSIFYLIIIILLVVSIVSTDNDMEYVVNLPIDAYGVETSIQDYNGRTVSFFLTKELQLTNLSMDVSINSKIVNVTDSTGCLVQDAIDIYDNTNYFQGIITEVSGNRINFNPSLDVDFSSGSNVKCGEWNMNVDGSTTMQRFYINPPKKRAWDIESLAIQFKDNSDWDINTFGSRSALENGFVLLTEDGFNQKLFLIYNNGGFALRGGSVQNFQKAPAGLYGFNVNIDIEDVYGSVLAIDGENEDKIVAEINDDLTSQTEIALTVRGHYKDE